MLALRHSQLKAEAQYHIAQAHEKIGMHRRGSDARGIPQQAVQHYQKCAAEYPESAYAGKSLEKVVQYYIDAEDYPRAIDLMEMVFQDFVDAAFLDVMLLKWAIAAQKMGDLPLARRKLDQLITEYPDSKAVRTAIRFRQALK